MALRIEPLPEGGILITSAPSVNGGSGDNPNVAFGFLFAASDLDEALLFIRSKLAPAEQPASCEVKGCERDASASLASGERVCIDHLWPDVQAERKQAASKTIAGGLSAAAMAGCECSLCRKERRDLGIAST
jgi:hypothetical protein